MSSSLNVRVKGKPGETNVLLLHGFLGRIQDWDTVIRGLPESWCVAAIDLPGHGESLGLPGSWYTFPGLLEGLENIMAGITLEPWCVLGYSMGGRIALLLALEYPERVQPLILESASPGLEDKNERIARQHRDEQLATRLEQAGLDRFLNEWYQQPLFQSLSSYAFESMVNDRRNNDPMELAKSLRGHGTGVQPSAWGQLETLVAPTLALAGHLDDKFSRIARSMSDLSGNVEAGMVPDAGHVVHADQPEEFIRRVIDFVTQAQEE